MKMPTYKVKAVGFHGGKLYDPEGKRKTLTVDKPFPAKKMPSWLAPMPKEPTKAAVKVADKAAADDAAKAEQDAKDIEDASFLGAGENANDVVETI